MSSEPPLVGIDLGTTNSLCAVFRDGTPRLIPNALGAHLTPSVVAVVEDGHVLVGAAARDHAVTHPDAAAATFKRWMGTDKEVTLRDRTFTPAELSSLVLKSLAADAAVELGAPVVDAVITVPAYFNEHQRQATQIAGRLAGLNVRRIINEPTAAALVYGFHEQRAEKTLLVLDLGGGTFDVTVMDVFEGTLEITATAGESRLGGEDFTDRLLAWALRDHGLALETAELRTPHLVARLRAQCETAKRTLGARDDAVIRIPADDGSLADDGPTSTIDRATFREISAQLLTRLERPILRALGDASHRPEDVDDVILVGGATRMPLVRDLARTIFEKDPRCEHDPDHVVALGAAVQTALMRDDEAVGDMVMTDVCPFTLGVEIVKNFGQRMEDGYFLPVIDRNTTIPTSREEVVQTVERNQSEILVRIFQGEARRVKDNLLLGELSVKGIPRGDVGQPVHLRFTYDINGILEVEAYIPETGAKSQIIVKHRVKGLTEPEIKRAIQRMQSLKFYPRDEARNRRLVEFAERITGEVSPFERDGLNHAIDGFEHAMAAGEREAFRTARRNLLIVLSSVGHPFADDDPETDADDE